MISELEKDDLISENQLFRTIFQEVSENLENKSFDPWKHFVFHPNGAISKLATDLLSEKHNESKIWKRGGGYTEQEEDILDLLVPKIINEYKLRLIKILLPKLENELVEDNEKIGKNPFTEDFLNKMQKRINLDHIKKELSDKLGNRTII